MAQDEFVYKVIILIQSNKKNKCPLAWQFTGD